MPRKCQLSKEQLETIIDHIRPLLDGQRSILERLPKLLPGESDDTLEGQRKYLRNSISTMDWIIATAKQRAGVKDE